MDVAEDVRVVGDLAFARGTYADKSTPKVPGAAVIDDKGKWVDVYKRQPDGSWKTIVNIWNSDLPPVQVLAPGSVDEQALLQLERDWAKVEFSEVSDMRAVVFGDHAVVNGLNTSKATVLGKDVSGKYRWTDILEKQDGRWRAVTTYLVKIE